MSRGLVAQYTRIHVNLQCLPPDHIVHQWDRGGGPQCICHRFLCGEGIGHHVLEIERPQGEPGVTDGDPPALMDVVWCGSHQLIHREGNCSPRMLPSHHVTDSEGLLESCPTTQSSEEVDGNTPTCRCSDPIHISRIDHTHLSQPLENTVVPEQLPPTTAQRNS